jgi:hypothetical protein
VTYPAPAFDLPRFLQKGRGETLDLPVRAGSSSVVAPVSATYSLYDSVGVVVVNAGVATVTAGVATYALPSTFADSYTLPQDPWRESWALTGLSGAPSPMTFERQVQLCRVAPTMLVTPETLFRMHGQWRNQLPKSRANYNEPIEDAWGELVGRLLGDGHLPSRILNNHALAVVHKYWSAHLVCRDFATDVPSDTKWSGLADKYWERSQDEYENHLGLQADQDEDGVAEQPGVLESAEPPLYATDVPWTDFPFGGPRRDW